MRRDLEIFFGWGKSVCAQGLGKLRLWPHVLSVEQRQTLSRWVSRLAESGQIHQSRVDRHLQSLLIDVERLTVPATCVGCHRSLDPKVRLHDWSERTRWCIHCLERFHDRILPGCPSCGAKHAARQQPLETDGLGSFLTVACPRCPSPPWRVDAVVSIGNYHGFLRDQLLGAKRMKQPALIEGLVDLLVEAVAQSDPAGRLSPPPCDLLVPIPNRKRRWWVNSKALPELLAARLSMRLGIPVAHDRLVFNRPTRKQGQLTRTQRRANLAKAMQWQPEHWARRGSPIAGARVAIIDDVMTTGATLCEAARVLKRSGARSVQGWVLARGLGSD